MRAEFKKLDARAAVAVGDAMDVSTLLYKTLQVDGPFTASMDVEVSLNNNAFYKIGASIAAPGLVDLPQTCKWLRIRTTAWTSGTPVVTLGGFNSRTDV